MTVDRTSLGGLLKRLALVTAAALIALTGCGLQDPPPVSEKVQAAAEQGSTLAPRPTVTAQPVAPLQFQAGTHTVIFGDSWTSGLFMEPATNGYAYKVAAGLGLDAQVIGGNGTGYLNAGSQNLGSYSARIAALPVSDAKLLIIQGSVNDLGRNMNDLGAAFDDVIAKAKQKFPQAQIVVIGPSTAQWPVQSTLFRADSILSERAGMAGIAYISPYQGQWINEANFSTMIDAKTGHPSVAGHAYLASKVEESLNALKAK